MSVEPTLQPRCTNFVLFGFGYPALVPLTSVDQNGVQFGIDPTIAPGVDAPIGTLGLYSDGATGKLYQKTSASPTGWTLK